jgi:hypothetical protein
MLDSVCEDCDPKCKTCEVTTTNCTSCDLENSYRTKVGSSCVCIDGYFDNSVPVCQKCSHSCMLCDSSGCTLCHSNSYRTFVNKSCPCNAGYYDNNESSICRPCHSSCVTCVLPTSCLTCNTTLNKSVSLTTGLCDMHAEILRR